MTEQEMLKMLGSGFTHYVGKDEQNIARTNAERFRKGVSHRKARLMKARQLELDKLREKQYLAGKYAFQRIVDLCCFVYNLSEEQLFGKCRKKHLVQARRALIFMLREKRKMSYPEIGRRLGRDHSTMIHHYLVAKESHDPRHSELAERIEEYQG